MSVTFLTILSYFYIFFASDVSIKQIGLWNERYTEYFQLSKLVTQLKQFSKKIFKKVDISFHHYFRTTVVNEYTKSGPG